MILSLHSLRFVAFKSQGYLGKVSAQEAWWKYEICIYSAWHNLSLYFSEVFVSATVLLTA